VDAHSTTYSGSFVQAEEILWLRGWIEVHPHWSRKRLARELACSGNGWTAWRLKDFAARSFLLKLEGQGQI